MKILDTSNLFQIMTAFVPPSGLASESGYYVSTSNNGYILFNGEVIATVFQYADYYGFKKVVYTIDNYFWPCCGFLLDYLNHPSCEINTADWG
jgi:hypothetical protein